MKIFNARRRPGIAAATCLLLAATATGAIAQDKVKLTSSAFAENQSIPKVYTCEGKDISPPLSWSGLPEKAKSLALIVDDPDAPDPAAPKLTWVHWVLYNIPASATGLGDGASALPKAHWKARITGSAPVTADPVHRSDGIAIFTSCMRSTRASRFEPARQKSAGEGDTGPHHRRSTARWNVSEAEVKA
jgi:phosphatidylethanolamine-binding protein (PEBP) family uncharacterized protein